MPLGMFQEVGDGVGVIHATEVERKTVAGAFQHKAALVLVLVVAPGLVAHDEKFHEFGAKAADRCHVTEILHLEERGQGWSRGGNFAVETQIDEPVDLPTHVPLEETFDLADERVELVEVTFESPEALSVAPVLAEEALAFNIDLPVVETTLEELGLSVPEPEIIEIQALPEEPGLLEEPALLEVPPPQEAPDEAMLRSTPENEQISLVSPPPASASRRGASCRPP